jgi:hypothetical protein
MSPLSQISGRGGARGLTPSWPGSARPSTPLPGRLAPCQVGRVLDAESAAPPRGAPDGAQVVMASPRPAMTSGFPGFQTTLIRSARPRRCSPTRPASPPRWARRRRGGLAAVERAAGGGTEGAGAGRGVRAAVGLSNLSAFSARRAFIVPFFKLRDIGFSGIHVPTAT